MNPAQAQTHTGLRGGQHLILVAEQSRTRAIGQHPAQEMRIKVCLIFLRCKPRTTEQARRHFTGYGHAMTMRSKLNTLGHRLQSRDTRSANPVYGMHFQRGSRQFTLNRVGKTGHQQIPTRRAAGQQTDIAHVQTRLLQATADGIGGHGRIAPARTAIFTNGVVALLNAVLGQNALLDTPRNTIQGGNKVIHGGVIDRLTGHEPLGLMDNNVLKGHGHRNTPDYTESRRRSVWPTAFKD